MLRPAAPAVCATLLALAAGTASAQYSTPMRDVENPDRSAFMASANGTLDAPFVNGFLFFATPAGRRYFIDYVTLNCTTPNVGDGFSQVLLGTRQNVTNGSIGYVAPAIVMERRGPAPFGGYIWSGTANVKMFSDADQFTAGGGSSISMNIFHTDTTSRATCSGFVYGHSLAP
jgi:hypothetical protein